MVCPEVSSGPVLRAQPQYSDFFLFLFTFLPARSFIVRLSSPDAIICAVCLFYLRGRDFTDLDIIKVRGCPDAGKLLR
jgi:hypothetical protein